MDNIKKIATTVFVIVGMFIFQNISAQELSKTDKKEYKFAEKERHSGNFKQSQEIFQKLAKKYAQNEDILYGAANSSYKLKDYDNAINYYNTLSVILDRKVDDLRFKPKKSNKEKKEYLKLRDLKKLVKNEYTSCKSLQSEFALLNNSQRQTDLKKTHDEFKKEDDRATNSSKEKDDTVDNSTKQSQQLEDYVKPTFITSTSNSGNVKKSTETNFISNKNTAYSACISPGFTTLNSVNKSGQIEEVQKSVHTVYDSLKQQKTEYIAEYEDIIRKSHKWTKDNALKQYDWFEELKSKENKYRSILDAYNDLLYERQKIENELKLAINDSLIIADKIESISKDSSRLSHNINISLKDELRSKLSTIPRSIVLVGRVKQEGSQGAGKEVENLMTTMNRMAIKMVNGHQILNAKLSENDNLTGLYEMTSEGIAQTADKYFQSLRKYLDDEGIDEIYSYQIYRIEVFPFNDANNYNQKLTKNDEYTSSQSLLTDIDVYRVSENGETFIKLLDRDNDYYDGPTSRASDHQFRDEESRFVQMISTTSDKFNQEYDKKIQEAIAQYHEDYNKYKSEISSLSNRTIPLKNEMNQASDNIESLRALYNKIDLERESKFYNEYALAKSEYEHFYSQKHQFISQLEIHSIDKFDNLNYAEAFKEIAKKSYEAVSENLSKIYNRTTIYRESIEGNNTLNLSEVQIDYSHIICSYKILTLGKYRTGNTPPYLALNIAFQIQWVLDGEFIENSPLADDRRDSEALIGKEAKIEFNSTAAHINWDIFNDNPTSIFEYSTQNKDNSWRQSSYKDLITLFSDSTNIDLLRTKVPAKNSRIILASRDTYRNDDNMVVYKGLVISDSGHKNLKYVEVSDGETVYIILIRK